jgi:hypothetical protein
VNAGGEAIHLACYSLAYPNISFALAGGSLMILLRIEVMIQALLVRSMPTDFFEVAFRRQIMPDSLSVRAASYATHTQNYKIPAIPCP